MGVIIHGEELVSSFNRMANAANRFQRFDKHKRVVTVCSAGLLRSPTAAWILGNKPFSFNTRACGSSEAFALVVLDEVLVEWADAIVFVSEANHQEARGRLNLTGKELHVLNVPDNFEFRDAKLVAELTRQLKEAFNK